LQINIGCSSSLENTIKLVQVKTKVVFLDSFVQIKIYLDVQIISKLEKHF